MTASQPMADSVRQVREQLRARADRGSGPARPDLPDEMLSEIADVEAERGRHRWQVLVPARFLTVDVDLVDPAVRADLEAWAEKPDGRNLVLFGPVGTGKTSAAFCALRPLVEIGADALFVPQAELIDRLDWRRPDSSAWLDRTCEAGFLFVDDLGSGQSNSWSSERLYVILNRRWMEGRPTIATTNLEPDGLAESLGPRSYSRLVGSDSVALRLSGSDRRRG